jgi:hypothetical protein
MTRTVLLLVAGLAVASPAAARVSAARVAYHAEFCAAWVRADSDRGMRYVQSRFETSVWTGADGQVHVGASGTDAEIARFHRCLGDEGVDAAPVRSPAAEAARERRAICRGAGPADLLAQAAGCTRAERGRP